MEYVKDLETPAVIVDLDIMEKNLKHTAELARNAGVKLRPTAKPIRAYGLRKNSSNTVQRELLLQSSAKQRLWLTEE